ncbi:fumarylacetoacetate hydrolase family protein [Porphyrobacter sp. CACIAM 03H1]|uniref:fumarylacetoacetate hydrolase family protein n=1 Tax=Porphyrobacter sp. CACIAM 03H1 TaxID=2003315 RepID=UPI000B5A5706|nr:fumarylacetoacetate hydrolase family protein [Porphyrobacter sp. CACIAM 03H1]ASJ90353.1 fumarylacetoacetate hydrolase [Porphyrobacter sp. CACIAM 03H1]
MTLLFDPQPPVLAPTSDGRFFPVRRIFCIGRNYEEHAREMGDKADPEAPFFFTKWAETVVGDGATIAYPQGTSNFHYEAELVVAIHRPGRNIPRERALDHVWGYAAGLDMTRRDLQSEARAKQRPWDAGKNVEQSSPLGLIHPASALGDATKGALTLTVNGVERQRGDLSQMITPVDRLIAFLSGLYRLEAGDLIYTGTPAGVGAVVPGDVIVVAVQGLTSLTITVGQHDQ